MFYFTCQSDDHKIKYLANLDDNTIDGVVCRYEGFVEKNVLLNDLCRIYIINN